MTHTFLDKFVKRCPKITFIGMSGLGKSYWSKKMVDYGFKRLCCDDVIADRLGKLSNRARIADLGEWMGFPYQPEYKSKEKIYLSLEIKVLKDFIDQLANADAEENIVIDTTGSAPYAGDDVMNQLCKHSCVIYLAASKQYFSEMLDRYIDCPRPVLWGDKFKQEPFESTKQALARSYEELLIYRDRLYKKYAHHIVPYEMHRI